jgi:hypothetical protein
LTQAYPGFCKLWEKSNWRFPVTQAITWLIEAATTSGSTEGAITFCQIPLEMLAWIVFVDEQPLVDAKLFDGLHAADKFHLLLDRCGIPIGIPSELKSLTAIADEASKKYTGPKIITYIRNSIVHPKESNRKELAGLVTKAKVARQQAYREALQLFTWYTTLVLLRLMEYRGEYANRLALNAPEQLEKVPWAT